MKRFLHIPGFLLLTLALSTGQEVPAPSTAATVDPNAPAAASSGEEADIEYVCPMASDKDVRSKTPGFCPRCKMKLVPDVPDQHEYYVHLNTSPRSLKVGEETQLQFVIEDPVTSKPATEFEIMHEKLYHLFVVSQDMRFFIHTHPQIQPDGSFQLKFKFPKPGYYRVLSDFYPTHGTPQLIANSLVVPGADFKLEPAKLEPDVKSQHSENLDVELVTEPAQPIVGQQTLMFFRLRPNDGIEPYLGAMGHMMAASSDLIDMIHTHPIYVRDPDGADYKQIQFNMIFPRTGIYRVWIQFQRKGVVNTVAFNVPVSELK